MNLSATRGRQGRSLIAAMAAVRSAAVEATYARSRPRSRMLSPLCGRAPARSSITFCVRRFASASGQRDPLAGNVVRVLKAVVPVIALVTETVTVGCSSSEGKDEQRLTARRENYCTQPGTWQKAWNAAGTGTLESSGYDEVEAVAQDAFLAMRPLRDETVGGGRTLAEATVAAMKNSDSEAEGRVVQACSRLRESTLIPRRPGSTSIAPYSGKPKSLSRMNSSAWPSTPRPVHRRRRSPRSVRHGEGARGSDPCERMVPLINGADRALRPGGLRGCRWRGIQSPV